MALRQLGGKGPLRQLQGEARRRLLHQLDELIRKQDYRFMGEPDRGEGDSWLRRRRSRKLPPSKSELTQQAERIESGGLGEGKRQAAELAGGHLEPE